MCRLQLTRLVECSVLKKSAMTPRRWLFVMPELFVVFVMSTAMMQNCFRQFKLIDSVKSKRLLPVGVAK
jgi:carbon starvation protein CstA